MMKNYAIGIDMGGTGTKFGLVNGEGQVLRSSSIPTQQYPEISDFCDTLCHQLKQLMADEGISIENFSDNNLEIFKEFCNKKLDEYSPLKRVEKIKQM